MQLLNYKMRTAVPEDIPALRENWRISFGDTDDYLDFFFSRRFVPDNTLVAEMNGKVVSQLFLLPSDLITQDGVLQAEYLFAAATHPEYRGQGIMASLLKKTGIVCFRRHKAAIVLLPGSRALYDYYKKLGYKTDFFRRRLDITRDELSRLSDPVEHADALSAIGAFLAERNGLWWDNDAVTYALDEHRLFRGPYAASKHAFVCVSDGEATCLCDPQYFGECATLLLELSDRNRFSLILPSDFPFGTLEDGGMIFRLRYRDAKLRDAFISFAMD